MERTTLITGAEAVARIIRREKIQYVFAYPGTSELALCDAILRTPGITLINGRGDKESAFMAAGGCLLSPLTAVAILHGARGLTNAAGAIADTYRNEISTLFLVGLPYSYSAPFLPPHGEHNLIKAISNFVKEAFEITEIAKSSDCSKEIHQKAKLFVEKINEAIMKARSLPRGPTLVGIPQDASELHWIPEVLIDTPLNMLDSSEPNETEIRKASKIIQQKKRPLILVDDFLFKTTQAKEELVVFAEAIRAPVLQIRYRRGQMLFERLSPKQNPYFVASYNPERRDHIQLMRKTDLLVTIEDRNAYERVIGPLPNCQKIAITSNPTMTRKNGYLKSADILVFGNIAKVMARIYTIIKRKDKYHVIRFKQYCGGIRKDSIQKTPFDPKFNFMRTSIAEELVRALNKILQPILIDDSQMFGGVLLESYDKFPSKVRVFGDHGGFIGSGIPYATGLACCNKRITIFCTLGDQSFTNGVQGLIAAKQEKAKVVFILCNNGKSVSLFKQALSQNYSTFDKKKNSFLSNVPHFSYSKLVKGLGIPSFKITFEPNSKNRSLSNPQRLLRTYLSRAIKIDGPVLIELELPANLDAWVGVWTVKGNEGIMKFPKNL